LKKENKGKKFITLIIHIDKWKFQAKSLFGHKVVDGCIMATLFLQPIRTEDVVYDVVGQKR